jgi:hypothetical protein
MVNIIILGHKTTFLMQCVEYIPNSTKISLTSKAVLVSHSGEAMIYCLNMHEQITVYFAKPIRL